MRVPPKRESLVANICIWDDNGDDNRIGMELDRKRDERSFRDLNFSSLSDEGKENGGYPIVLAKNDIQLNNDCSNLSRHGPDLLRLLMERKGNKYNR